MGFVQYYLSRILKSCDIFAEVLTQKVVANRTFVLDFSSPNIAKSFHVGNLRSTLLGNFIQNIYRRAGHKVVSINYLGDWGTQMSLLLLQWRSENIDLNRWKETLTHEKIRLLTRMYVEANSRMKHDPKFRDSIPKLLASMEMAWISGETPASNENLAQWKEFRDVSEEYFQNFYKKFLITFDVWEGESNYILDAYNLAENMINNGKAFQINGLWAIGDSSMYHVLRKSDKTTLYLPRDYGAIVSRNASFNADQYLYIVDSAQASHFEGLKSLLHVNGLSSLAEKITHVSYGRVAGLSTRKGTSEAVDVLIDHGMELAEKFIRKSPTLRITTDEIPSVTQQLAITAIIMNDLAKRRNKQYKFSFDQAFQLTDYSSIAPQMKHTRLNSLCECHSELVAKICSGSVNIEEVALDPSIFANTLYERIISLDDALFTSYESMEPYIIVEYLQELSKETGQAFKQLLIQGEPEEIALPRLILFLAIKRILFDGMQLLGIKPLEKM